jgi:hypothetical protein
VVISGITEDVKITENDIGKKVFIENVLFLCIRLKNLQKC